jgi:hypothetical protein
MRKERPIVSVSHWAGHITIPARLTAKGTFNKKPRLHSPHRPVWSAH